MTHFLDPQRIGVELNESIFNRFQGNNSGENRVQIHDGEMNSFGTWYENDLVFKIGHLVLYLLPELLNAARYDVCPFLDVQEEWHEFGVSGRDSR